MLDYIIGHRSSGCSGNGGRSCAITLLLLYVRIRDTRAPIGAIGPKGLNFNTRPYVEAFDPTLTNVKQPVLSCPLAPNAAGCAGASP